MGIDIVIAILLVIAFLKGYSQGIIMSVFSFAAYLIGFFVTMNLSFIVSDYLSNNLNIPGKWLPIIAFILTFATVVLLVKMVGKLIEKGMSRILPTMFNRLLGSALWITIVVILSSLLLQVLLAGNLFEPRLLESSIAFPYLEEVGLFIKENIGDVIPLIKNLFHDVDEYFKGLPEVIDI